MSTPNTTILIVDDEERIRHCLGGILQRAGYSVATAANGAEALELAHGQTFSLVVLDVFMPRKGGFETLIEFQERHPHTKVLVITGGGLFSAGAPLEVAASLGADGVLTKPFGSQEFLAAVRKLAQA